MNEKSNLQQIHGIKTVLKKAAPHTRMTGNITHLLHLKKQSICIRVLEKDFDLLDVA